MIEIQDKQILIQEYDCQTFVFSQIFFEHCRDELGCSNLEELHRYIPQQKLPNQVLKVGEDQKTFAHEILYKIDPEYQRRKIQGKPVKDRGFIKLYKKFITFLEEQVFFEKLVYQSLPTLRIQLPDNLSVGEYHRDSDYNHPTTEINIWIPITRASGTATIHLESSYECHDFRPMELKYGQYLVFDSALKHGNEVNREGYTRISFDFRVIPLSKYVESELSSINQNMQFKIGDYYSINHKLEGISSNPSLKKREPFNKVFY